MTKFMSADFKRYCSTAEQHLRGATRPVWQHVQPLLTAERSNRNRLTSLLRFQAWSTSLVDVVCGAALRASAMLAQSPIPLFAAAILSILMVAQGTSGSQGNFCAACIC